MGRKKRLCLKNKINRGSHGTHTPTGVGGFLDPTPDPPPVKRTKKLPTPETPRFTETKTTMCDSGTQTDNPPSRVDASVQTDPITLDQPIARFLQDALVEKNEKLSHLENTMATLFPADAPSVPFLLSYPLMCLLVLNLRFALHTLFSPNTNSRKRFVQVLLSGLESSKNLLATILGFSSKTIQRSFKLPPAPKLSLIGLKVKRLARKSPIPQQAFRDAKRILDVLAPVKSGKTYRVVTCSLGFLYEQYRALASQTSSFPSISYRTFIGKVLDIKNNYVHFERNPDFCPLCREFDVLQLEVSPTPTQAAKIQLLQEHQRIAKCQWKVYHKILGELVTNPTFCLVVQDFNQQHSGMSLQTQVLTLVVYAAPNGYLERHYYNYFLPANQSNNLTAVIACHRDFFFNPHNSVVANATHIDIFNDGGPKHFKLTGYLAHMSAVSAALTQQQRPKTITQHYFASYHGSGPADAVASHIKRKIHFIRANNRHNISSVQEMATLCGEIESTDKAIAVVIPPELHEEEASVSVETYTGIKKFHKATFALGLVVSLWVDSSSVTPTLCKALQATGVLL